MTSERNIKINILQVLIIITAVIDLLCGIFFLFNPESLSAKLNLMINQPEDKLWRQFLGVYFIMSVFLFFPSLFAPMQYRHSIWISNVFRPIFMALILAFATVGITAGEHSISWMTQQPVFYVQFWIFLLLGISQLGMLIMTRTEAKEARKLGIQ